MSVITWDGVDADFANGLWQAIREAEAATGSKARINSVVRSPEKQAQLYADFSGRTFTYRGATYRPSGRHVGLAAKPPGFEGAPGSRHTIGQAADTGGGPVLRWLHSHQDYIRDKYGIEFLKGNAFKVDPGHIQKVGAGSGGRGGRTNPGAPNPEWASRAPDAPVATTDGLREPDFNAKQGGSKFRNGPFNEKTGRGIYQTSSGNYISFDRKGNTIFLGKTAPAPVPTAASAGIEPPPTPRAKPLGRNVPLPRPRPSAQPGATGLEGSPELPGQRTSPTATAHSQSMQQLRTNRGLLNRLFFARPTPAGVFPFFTGDRFRG